MSDEIVKRWMALGRAGFTVSICYGPCGTRGHLFSVYVLTPDFRSFDKPFLAQSLDQAIEIAEKEIKERGWGLHETSRAN